MPVTLAFEAVNLADDVDNDLGLWAQDGRIDSMTFWRF